MSQKIPRSYIIQNKRVVALLKIYGYECCADSPAEYWYTTDFEIDNKVRPYRFPDGNALILNGVRLEFYHQEPLTMQSSINELWTILNETGQRDLANKIWDAVNEINGGKNGNK